MLASILIVTGPTVILPLIRQHPIKRHIANILKWESILVDLVGVILPVLMFDILFLSQQGETWVQAGISLLMIVGTGCLFGLVGAFTLILLIENHLIPEYLQEVVTLIMVISCFTIANILVLESGFIAVSLMGIILANQKRASVRHIVVFKENITVLLLSSIFIILAARTNLQDLFQFITVKGFLFIAALILIIRPLSVLISTMGTNISFKERLFLGAVAPRGIIAAAVSSLFTVQLLELGFEYGNQLVSITFFVIITSVLVYSGLFAVLSKWLDVQTNIQDGLLLVGISDFSLGLANQLRSIGIDISFADTNREYVIKARAAGYKVYHHSVFSSEIQHEIDIGHINSVMALTPSDETNVLASLQFHEELSKKNVYCLSPLGSQFSDRFHKKKLNFLFSKTLTYSHIQTKLIAGAEVKSIDIHEDDQFQELKEQGIVPLIKVHPKNGLSCFVRGTRTNLKSGDTLIYI